MARLPTPADVAPSPVTRTEDGRGGADPVDWTAGRIFVPVAAIENWWEFVPVGKCAAIPTERSWSTSPSLRIMTVREGPDKYPVHPYHPVAKDPAGGRVIAPGTSVLTIGRAKK